MILGTKRATQFRTLETTELGLGYSRQNSVARVKSGRNESLQQLFSDCLGEDGTNVAGVPKVGGRAHSADMSAHAHAHRYAAVPMMPRFTTLEDEAMETSAKGMPTTETFFMQLHDGTSLRLAVIQLEEIAALSALNVADAADDSSHWHQS